MVFEFVGHRHFKVVHTMREYLFLPAGDADPPVVLSSATPYAHKSIMRSNPPLNSIPKSLINGAT
ncbi:hypothetical protein HanRHA438_Chr02g0096121 [Helianthus annuus]|uniref:Uncharacterized protein n=1 Tax=Helianthus annuus TaxID=4232 RepID=A0A9K3P115_HELAN|nr:hypothetical protein HanXRQr2_Chr02g0084851 [Helianthus annuus]KAJ0620164.1 hypothetical protein HanHA89_Chr02g0079291 [Helianthus annuus]KAJ0778616.1 hypothetical protein HanLR1_Chr02g0073611 [Helianthus annuus]KAJ0941589.1 hypothetical protein HanRHA438_Chr02g0096121 [Helianthus annuus]KAJ0953280.1 hypothetical protein HanPSC8_Chr02g0082041 [Helianthus annuus]